MGNKSVSNQRSKIHTLALSPPKKWKQLEPFPFKYFAKPVHLNSNEFIVVPDKATDCLSEYIYKYNIQKDKWIKWIKFPKDLQIEYHTVSRNKKTKQMYICSLAYYTMDCGSTTSIVNEIDHKFIIHKNEQKVGQNPVSFIFNNEFNIIGGESHACHFIFNNKSNQLTTFFEFSKGMPCPTFRSLLYIHSKRIYLAFGATVGMYSFSVDNKTWTKLNETIPKPLSSFGYITTMNERYVIIFGGYADGVMSTAIYVLNLKDMTWKKSDIICPCGGTAVSIIVNNMDSASILIFGYVRRCWKLRQFNGMHYPSNDIVNLLSTFYSTESVHLLKWSNGKHWKMSVDNILNNIKYTLY